MEESVVNPDPAVVTVWSDIGCPWAALALHTLRAAAARRGVPLLVDHRAFPLELVNARPTPKAVLDAEVAVIGSHVPELGWAPWAAPADTYPVTTMLALEAVQAAKDPAVGGLPASDELDAALRTAFYVESRCISVHAVLLDVAAGCSRVDVEALRAALVAGSARRQVHRQRSVAEGSAVQGSGHVLTAGGFDEHNPGVSMRWTAGPGRGFPHIERLQPEWAEQVLAGLG